MLYVNSVMHICQKEFARIIYQFENCLGLTLLNCAQPDAEYGHFAMDHKAAVVDQVCNIL